MSTTEKDIQKMERAALKTTTPSFKQVDSAIRAMNVTEMEQENALLPATFGARLQQLVKVYSGVKPLLSVLAALPIIPATWRAALVLFNQALEAVTESAGDIGPDFKAGKDL
jgi:hypothetical protein